MLKRKAHWCGQAWLSGCTLLPLLLIPSVLLSLASTGCVRYLSAEAPDQGPAGAWDAGSPGEDTAAQSRDATTEQLARDGSTDGSETTLALLVVATGSNAASTPPSLADQSVPAGSPIYIKWQVTSDQLLPANPIDLAYSSDGVSYSPIVSGLPNAPPSDASCTVDTSRTGCYQWTSPGGYVQVRATVRDTGGTVVTALSSPLNAAPPTVAAVQALSVDQPQQPPTDDETSVSAGGAIYIKWRAGDDLPLPEKPIDLSYTTDELNYQPIATGLANTPTEGCTLRNEQTGCLVWRGPFPAGYFRVRVIATDADGKVSAASTAPLNVSPPLRFLAGNTDPGTNVSALSGLLLSRSSNQRIADGGALVVLPNGVIYVRDIERGIMKVDPADGVLRLLIPLGSASSGDGGPASEATVSAVWRLALDHQQRVLIFDGDRIRRIDTTQQPETIDTIIGGGSSLDDAIGPLEVRLPVNQPLFNAEKKLLLFAMPNGDIYFRADRISQTSKGGARLRVLRAATGQVESLSFSGIGDSGDLAQDISECRLENVGMVYDPASSQIEALLAEVSHRWELPACPAEISSYHWANVDSQTLLSAAPHPSGPSQDGVLIQGMDGQLYQVHRRNNRVYRFDRAESAWTVVLGSGKRGFCPDGTTALACDVDLNDLFVDAQGRIFFIDRGQLRSVDAVGRVGTVLGQSRHFGDGDDALSARFGRVTSLRLWRRDQQDRVLLLDAMALRIREFVIGGAITTLAGNGSNRELDFDRAATAQGLYVEAFRPNERIEVAPGSGDVFFSGRRSGRRRVVQLVRDTGQWVSLVGGGTTLHTDAGADGLPGAEVQIHGDSPGILGRDPSGLLVCGGRWTLDCRGMADVLMKHYSFAEGTQSPFAGVIGCADSSICADTTLTASCKLRTCHALTTPVYDPVDGHWLFLDSDDRSVRQLTAGGDVQTLVVLPRAALSIALDPAVDTLYYCATSDGRLYRYPLATGVEAAYPWPVPKMKCSGDTLRFSAERHSLIFVYEQDGVPGIAEYTAL
jgi:hypothetical protein